MAELIPISDIDVLKSAAEVKAVANEAVAIHEKNAVARLINLAANTGAHSAVWEHPISDALKSVLEGQGYKVTKQHNAADPDMIYTISGF